MLSMQRRALLGGSSAVSTGCAAKLVVWDPSWNVQRTSCGNGLHKTAGVSAALLRGLLSCSAEGGCVHAGRFQVHYNGYLKPFQEPWCYGADVEKVCRRFIVLRYQLIQLWSVPMTRSAGIARGHPAYETAVFVKFSGVSGKRCCDGWSC